MKRGLLILLTLLPLGCLAQHPLYEIYAMRKDLSVAQIEGFRINDTLRIDVLVLAADNDSCWQKLKQEFDIRTSVGTTSWLGEVQKPAQRIQWHGQPCSKVIASHKRRTICVYLLASRAQYEALLDYQMEAVARRR